MRVVLLVAVALCLTVTSPAYADAVWIADLISRLSPPDRLPASTFADETVGERVERYGAIARDVDAVVRAPDVRLPFSGRDAIKNTAVLVVSIMQHESGFALDVDKGPCRPGWCDGGRSVCLMQVMVGRGTTAEGWTREDLFNDRQKCIRAGLRTIRQSFASCRHLDRPFWLAQYASGSCIGEKGHARSREMFALLQRNLRRVPEQEAAVRDP